MLWVFAAAEYRDWLLTSLCKCMQQSVMSISAVQKHGLAASAASRAQFADKAQLDELTDKTWRRLRMRSLTRHPELGPDKFRAACLRLLAASRDLSFIFDGLKIQLGLDNAVSEAGDVIEVAWDFEV